MKQLFILLFFINGPGNAWSASVSGSMTGLKIASCTSEKKKCYSLKSADALMSQFLPLYTFKNFSLQIVENDVSSEITGASGFIDLANRQIVVQNLKTSTEFSIHMDTLQQRDFSK